MKKLSILLLSILILSACSVVEDVNISNNLSGTSSTDIEVYPFFIEVLNDFSEFLPENEGEIMDKAIIDFSASLSNTGKAENVSVHKTGDNRYLVSFEFHSIEELINSLGQNSTQSVLSQTTNSLSFYLDINNYAELKTAIPFLADPQFEVYGPEYNIGISEADYLDMITYLLGEEGPEAITESLISINIKTPGSITKAEGLRKTGDKSAVYEFPLIDFLLLAEPMSFTLEWK